MGAARIFRALLIGVAIPPAIAMLVWGYVLRLDPAYLADAVSFRLFYLLFLLMLAVELGRCLVRRSLSGTLLSAGVVLLLLQGITWYGFRFSGMTGVGLDEQPTEYYLSHCGAFIKPPRIPLRVVSLDRESKSVVLTRDGIETRLESGKKVERDGFVFCLKAIEEAPLVSVRSVRGEIVDEAFLKLTSTGEQDDFIMFGRLPHRFYVKQVQHPERGEAMFRIKVVRDKLTISDSLVPAGESVYFDGHYVVCRPGGLWARISVEKRQSLLLSWLGLGLVGVAAAAAVTAKRSGG